TWPAPLRSPVSKWSARDASMQLVSTDPRCQNVSVIPVVNLCTKSPPVQARFSVAFGARHGGRTARGLARSERAGLRLGAPKVSALARSALLPPVVTRAGSPLGFLTRRAARVWRRGRGRPRCCLWPLTDHPHGAPTRLAPRHSP